MNGDNSFENWYIISCLYSITRENTICTQVGTELSKYSSICTCIYGGWLVEAHISMWMRCIKSKPLLLCQRQPTAAMVFRLKQKLRLMFAVRLTSRQRQTHVCIAHWMRIHIIHNRCRRWMMMVMMLTQRMIMSTPSDGFIFPRARVFAHSRGRLETCDVVLKSTTLTMKRWSTTFRRSRSVGSCVSSPQWRPAVCAYRCD